MSSQDWDVDQYRMEHESEEHWELRRNFMLAHKDKLPEDEIVCMAQVFTNIEFMGCRYPDQTMARVAELAKGVVEKFREKKKGSLKRTFVAASDAASAKVKGLKRSGSSPLPDIDNKYRKCVNFLPASVNSNHQLSGNSSSTSVITVSDSGEESVVDEETKSQPQKQSYQQNGSLVVNPFGPQVLSNKRYGGVRTFNINPSEEVNKIQPKPLAQQTKKLNGPFPNFVLFLKSQEHPVSSIERNASINKHTTRWDSLQAENSKKCCKLFLNGTLVSSGVGDILKSAKENAAIAGLEKLQKWCYTIKVKAQFFSDKTVDSSLLGTSQGGPVKASEELADDNVGRKLMKLMGWTGGGLGSKQQGIEEPIKVALQVRREGLGQSSQGTNLHLFKNMARDYVKSWLSGNCDQDLVFSSEFSNEERKALHELASKLSLKSRSYGKGEDRHLVISKKFSPMTLVRELERTGGVSDKYELICPKEGALE